MEGSGPAARHLDCNGGFCSVPGFGKVCFTLVLVIDASSIVLMSYTWDVLNVFRRIKLNRKDNGYFEAIFLYEVQSQEVAATPLALTRVAMLQAPKRLQTSGRSDPIIPVMKHRMTQLLA